MFGRQGGGFGAPSRPVCKFFLEGRCKFGDSCKNEHPRSQAPQPNNSNRFAPLQNPSNAARGRSNGVSGQDAKNEPFGITTSAIQRDLTSGGEDGERPTWPFSAYAPGVNPPRQLIEGAMEQSPEEMRVQYYIAQAAGNPNEYVQKEQTMVTQMNDHIRTILNDLEGAKKYVIDGQNQHPNRHDMVIRPNRPFPRSNAPAAAASASGFGSSSGFGAPSAPTTSGFGQPSNLGASRSAFGAPSTMGSAPSAFGQPSSLGGSGAASSGFGQPSALGGGGSSFGQPSAMGQKAPFGAPTAPSAFGQPSTLGAASPFGSTPNQQTQQPQQQQSAFGQASQPSAFGQPSQPSAFGQPSQPSAFGQPSQPSAFGQPSTQQPSPFAAAQPAKASTFGQPSPFAAAAPSASPSPFAAAAAATQPQPPTSTFGQPTRPNPFAAATAPPASNPFAAASPAPPSAPLTLPTSSDRLPWAGKRTVQDSAGHPCYIASTPGQPDRLVRIWFPSGPPTTANALVEGVQAQYEGELGEVLWKVYEGVREKGEFGEGVMPEVPPRREWVSFDL